MKAIAYLSPSQVDITITEKKWLLNADLKTKTLVVITDERMTIYIAQIIFYRKGPKTFTSL